MTGSPYNLPDITEMWNAHLSAQSTQSASDPLRAASFAVSGDDEPLSLEFNVLVEAMYTCLKRFADNISASGTQTPERLDKRPGIYGSDSAHRRCFRRRAIAAAKVSALSGRHSADYRLGARVPEECGDSLWCSANEVLKLSEVETEYTRRWQCLRMDVNVPHHLDMATATRSTRTK